MWISVVRVPYMVYGTEFNIIWLLVYLRLQIFLVRYFIHILLHDLDYGDATPSTCCFLKKIYIYISLEWWNDYDSGAAGDF